MTAPDEPQHQMVIICGIKRGTQHTYGCPYCDFESDDLEDFGTSMCWNCVYKPLEEDNDGPI